MNTSISNANTNHLVNSASTHCTPTKKCPSSCGKLTEQTVFNFNDSYVTEYLKQQQLQHNQHSSHQNQVFNRPITRSITHHNNKFNGNGSEVATSNNALLATSNESNETNKSSYSNSSSTSAFSYAIEPPLCSVPIFNGK